MGLGLLRRWDLGILFGMFLAKTAFGTFMHVVVRYFDIAYVPMHLGLAVFLYCTIVRRRLPVGSGSGERRS